MYDEFLIIVKSIQCKLFQAYELIMVFENFGIPHLYYTLYQNAIS